MKKCKNAASHYQTYGVNLLNMGYISKLNVYNLRSRVYNSRYVDCIDKWAKCFRRFSARRRENGRERYKKRSCCQLIPVKLMKMQVNIWKTSNNILLLRIFPSIFIQKLSQIRWETARTYCSVQYAERWKILGISFVGFKSNLWTRRFRNALKQHGARKSIRTGVYLITFIHVLARQENFIPP